MTGSVSSATQHSPVAIAAARRGTGLPPGGTDLPAPAEAERPRAAEVRARVAVERLNAYMMQNRRALQFRVDEASGRTVITVVNPETREVVRQIPPEALLALSGWIDSGGRGALLRVYA